MISLSRQIDEVKRELAMRVKVYPHQIATGKLRPSIAEYQTASLLAVLDTLLGLQDAGPSDPAKPEVIDPF